MPIKTWKKSGVQACFAVFLLLSIHSLFPIAVEGVQESAPRTGEAGIQLKRFSRPPTLDGKPGPEWNDARIPAEFFEVSPLANAPAPVRTEAYLGYDADNLYFAFRCFDPEVRSIRANLTERDKLEFDDLAGLYIDTLGDGRRAYEFLVNPRGVQMDAVRTEGQREDFTWDGKWTSSARLTEDGYVIQGKIPFTNFTFTARPVEDWKILLVRIWPRDAGRVQMINGRMDFNNPCFVCQFPKLDAVEKVENKRPALGDLSVTGTLTTHRTDRPFQLRNHNETKADVGAFIHWGLTPRTRLDIAANPDFSQVEADVNQLAVNNRFAPFFPERRPFFQETNDIFAAPGTPGGFAFDGPAGIAGGTSGQPLDLFYSRSIARPIAAAKLIQQFGKGQFSFLWATDELPTIVLANANGSNVFQLPGESVDLVGRYSLNFWKHGTAGFSFTDMQSGGGHSLVTSTDVLLRPFRNFEISGQYAHSDADAMGSPELLTALAGRGTTGDAFNVRTDIRGAFYNVQAGYSDIGRDFRSDLGFVRQTDLRTLDTSGTVQWIPQGNPVFVRMGPSFRFVNSYNHNGLLMERSYIAGLLGILRGQVQTRVHAVVSTLTVSGIRFDDQKRVIGELQARPVKWLVPLNATFVVGDLVDLVNARRGNGYSLGLGGTFRPLSQLAFTVDTSRERLERKDTGAEVYHAQIARLNNQYYISRNADLTWVLQYSWVNRDPHQYVVPVLRSNHTLNSFFLFTYRFRPQLSLIAGYNDSFVGPKAAQVFDATHPIDDPLHPQNPGSCASDASVGASGFQGSANGLAGQALNSRCRSIFLKLSYSFHP